MRLSRLTVVIALLAVSIIAVPEAASAAVIVKATANPPFGNFQKKVTRVDPNTKVTFKAITGSHTVTAYGGGWRFNERIDNRPSPRPQQVSHRFRGPGTYQFRCTIHSQITAGTCYYMCGSVVVRNR